MDAVPGLSVPEPTLYDVAGGRLTARRFGRGRRLALAAHGITAHAMAWSGVADALPTAWSLVAVDLRGRGHSRDLGGPYGLRAHAADLHRVAEVLVEENGGPIPLVGHSMGAFVAVHTAAERPDLYSRLVLVDGGVALPLPEGADPDRVLEETLGPVFERLSQTYPSTSAYVQYFRAHPALEWAWDSRIEDYVRYDVLETGRGVTTRAVQEAVRADGRELLTTGETFEPEIRGLDMPVTILAAPFGMFGQPGGLLPTEGIAAYDDAPGVRVKVVPEVNHYTIIFEKHAARAVADAISG